MAVRKFETEMTYDGMLQKYGVSALKDIAKKWGLKGYSKLKKDDLVTLISDHVVIAFEEKFMTFNLDHIGLISQLSKGHNVFSQYPMAADELMGLGLILQGELEESSQVFMPKVILDRFISSYDQHQNLITVNTLFRDYLTLAIELYGVIESDTLINMFFEFNDGSIEASFIRTCLDFTVERTRNTLCTDNVLHYYRLSEYDAVLKDIKTKDELEYLEIDMALLQEFMANNMLWGEAHQAFKEMLMNDFKFDEEAVMNQIDELRVMLSYNHGISDYVQLFSKKHENSNMVQLKEFADKAISLHTMMNHWELKGKTPMMLSKYNKQMPIVKGDRTGRNDLCPCGSGKKYKKCCLN